MLRRRTLLVAGLLVAAGAWRALLSTRYFGWEESDYGNLAMVRGVLESGFTHFDMNHLPMYYGLSALVMAVVGDAVQATLAVSMLAGMLTVALTVVLGDRLAGRGVAWTAGAIAIVQPELALYAASSLREPVYAAAVIGCLVALTRERLAWASVLAGVAFLTRMDGLLTLGPALLIHALGRPHRLARVGAALGPLALLVFAWAAYCSVVHGTWEFWGHSVAVNIETGGTELAPDQEGWAMDGLAVSWALLTDVLPGRIGWALSVGAVVGIVGIPWHRHDPRRTVGITALCLLGFWLAIGFVAQHEPGHNLYWKWLHGVLPPLIVLATIGVWRVAEQLSALVGRVPVYLLAVAAVAQTARAFALETKRQLDVSAELYKPQLELAQWIESEVPEATPLLVDNIPGCWIDRREHGRTLHTWFDVPVEHDNRVAFGEWIEAEHIGYVLWFQEDWTQAPAIAPWLEQATAHHLGDVILVPLREEPGYGWVFYRVELVGG
ncbi:MAG TPA: glycosyltransferase family 39 protein [Myxococcota bacterium]|nr:glycosyltransferase family 39 protein [Myxococcota bacterium]